MSQLAVRTSEPRPVVVGYDGSQASQRAVVRAAEAAGPGGRLIVVTAIRAGDTGAPEDDLEGGGVEPAHLLEDAAALAGAHGVAVSTQVEEGDPVDVLVSVARAADASLIVVGVKGENYVARALRGLVPERLISRSPCDLLVTR